MMYFITQKKLKFKKLPVLGFVPFFNLKDDSFKSDFDENEKGKDTQISISNILDKDNKSLLKNTKFIFEETFRNIYTSIKFSNLDKEIKIINVTSTIPEEGKSICSLFLAINIAQISRKF